MKRVALIGTGVIGQRVAEVLARWPDACLVAIVSRNRPQWARDIPWYDSLDELDEPPSFLIDFSMPGGTLAAARWCRANLVPLVSGVNGIGNPEREALRLAAELVPVLWAANLSRGVNLMLRSVVETAALLPAEIPVEIIDIHHVHREDAPSGTALLIARALAAARGLDPEDCIAAGPEPAALQPGMIHCVSRREDEVVGEHKVIFRCRHERIVFQHKAEERDVYAAGAIEAGTWLLEQEAGLYSAADWLRT